MAFTNFIFEAVQDTSPGVFGFNAREGKVTRVWQLKVAQVTHITDAIRRILGGTQYAPTATGKLHRDLPLADPQFPWLYASNIGSAVGRGMRDPNPGTPGAGRFIETSSTNPDLSELICDSFGLYPHYDLTVESTPRPFVVAGDSRIDSLPGIWYNFRGDQIVYTYVMENLRYVDAAIVNTPQAIQGQQGTMVFLSRQTPPSGAPFAGKPMMYLPNEGLQVTWFQVPYRYITSANSYIAGRQGERPWFGCINYNSISFRGALYPSGSLMYLGYTVGPLYPRAVDVRARDANLLGGDPVYGAERYCDVTFNFGVTWRTAPADSLPAPRTNPNFLRAGWNLQPYLPDRRFHYAHSNPVAAGTTPTPGFYSFPVELLFMDPDFPQNNVIANQ